MSSYNVTTTDDDSQQSQQQKQKQMQQGPTFMFTQDEIIFIENVLVELRDMIPNDMGENQQLIEKIVLSEQIIGARLDPQAAEIGDSA